MNESTLARANGIQDELKKVDAVYKYFIRERGKDQTPKIHLGEYFTAARNIPMKEELGKVALNAIVNYLTKKKESLRTEFYGL